VADAEAGVLELAQVGICGGGTQHRAVVVARVAEQHRLAAFLEQPGRMGGPGVQPQRLR